MVVDTQVVQELKIMQAALKAKGGCTIINIGQIQFSAPVEEEKRGRAMPLTRSTDASELDHVDKALVEKHIEIIWNALPDAKWDCFTRLFITHAARKANTTAELGEILGVGRKNAWNWVKKLEIECGKEKPNNLLESGD